ALLECNRCYLNKRHSELKMYSSNFGTKSGQK
ncbi:unnamed protein product, partial [marine sediment metagenome]